MHWHLKSPPPPGPEAGTPPPGADSPPEQTPQDQRQAPPSPEADLPQEQTHTPLKQTPPAQCMLGDAGNKRAVRILLECILVNIVNDNFGCID